MEKQLREGELKIEKAVAVLTFTWSVGFRLADRHMRHLNVIHGWRLEGEGEEEEDGG